MYLHLGRDVIVKNNTIIGIFDMETTTTSKYTRKFITNAEKNMKVVNVSDDLPKSYILCVEDGIKTLYISQISSATLYKRSKSKNFVYN